MLQQWLKRKAANEDEEPARKRQKVEETKFDIRFEVVNSTDELLIGTATESPSKLNGDDEKRQRDAELRKQKQAQKSSKSLIEMLNFDPKAFESIDNFKEKFEEIADKLLNGTEIVAKNKHYRIIELEFYLIGGVHDDIFTHQDKQQLTSCQWYFHRTGNQYRSGNYKGLDLTFGKDCYGGILIRAIEDISTGKLFDGPCISVNQLLASLSMTEVTEIVKHEDFKWDAFDADNLLYLRDPKQPLPQRNLFACPRVGLTLKRQNGPRTLFLGKDYRYLTLPKDIKKGKLNMALSLFKQSKDIAAIYHQIGSTVATIKGWQEIYKAGLKNSDFSKFMGNDFQQPASFCEFMGTWKAIHGKEAKA